jgi:superfamily II DNA or RNA helicase
MLSIDEIRSGSKIKGLTNDLVSTIVSAEKVGKHAVKIVFEDNDGAVSSRLIFEDDCFSLELVSHGQFWSFDAIGDDLRLVTEANRIRMAYHFDPYLAVHTSLIDPLPHQITAVYSEMLTRQPLRFLLADDPGAGKTIMAGLLIKELLVRADLERCLIVVPGSLVDQWQDELGEKFSLEFDILTRDMIEGSRSGNPFNDRNFMIARLDVLARNEELQEKLEQSKEWDLIICDEAHRLSASVFGNEVNYTKRYKLGQKLSEICRHFLLMTATPHNGKDEDFQLFMALLDGDRFEGRYREGVHFANSADMMRRLTKEELFKFDGTPLFPERRAYTVKYELSDGEAALYAAVTEYVRTEMNRVQRFADEDNQKRVNISFALLILQRRLASSPAAIHSSLKRRKERLENQLTEERIIARGNSVANDIDHEWMNDSLKNIDELSQDDLENIEDEISNGLTSASTIEELKKEIETLTELEGLAFKVLQRGDDTKWNQLKKILDDELMTDRDGIRRKLIIFTEAKDTLFYLVDKIQTLLGRPEAVDCIHGGVLRENRRNIVQRFMQDKDLLILVANDAAGEGINLQRGHLMVNYDLPWNPNKIEQRFGRIHRIGQTEVCHLWNLVAADTREGEVYARLLEKIEATRTALQGQVFDVLGDLFEGDSLRELLEKAIQYGDRDDVKAKLYEKVDEAFDIEHIKAIISKRKLTNDIMPREQVENIRLEMERADAQRLQPHHIQGFFIEAFQRLGGKIVKRETGRFEVKKVPVSIMERDRQIGRGSPVQKSYERICFDKNLINQQPVAEFVFPGHPLLDSVIDLIYENFSHLMKQGAIMVDPSDLTTDLEAIFLVEHVIQDGCKTSSGAQQTISQRLQFVRLSKDGNVSNGGIAPHLNLRSITLKEQEMVQEELAEGWLQGNIEDRIKEFAIINLAQAHLKDVKERRLPEIDKVQTEVKQRLQQEIRYWDNRAEQLKEEEKAGRKTRVNWQNAQRRAEDLSDRLQLRLSKLKNERSISASTPVVKGGLVIIPHGLIKEKQSPGKPGKFEKNPDNRAAIEKAGMVAVMSAEKALGNEPRDVSADKCGYDIESFDTKSRNLRFIEVKGRTIGADTVTVTRNEIITSKNQPDKYILALVAVENNVGQKPKYVRRPFVDMEPDGSTISVNFNWHDLVARSEKPS